MVGLVLPDKEEAVDTVCCKKGQDPVVPAVTCKHCAFAHAYF